MNEESNSNNAEVEVKLYSLLINQLHNYEKNIWQIPIALIVGNFVALEKFPLNVIILISIAIFNGGVIFVLGRMMKSQRVIIEAVKKCESRLNEHYQDFLPDFSVNKHSIYSPYLFLYILVSLESIFILYIIFLISNHPF
ncbi:MAG: hypothetical protein J0M18_05105 [Ignavibacteria bacterium]|nr:hypothetical protein [Ignavibacteria bacterium]